MTLLEIYNARFGNDELLKRTTAAIGKVAWTYQGNVNSTQAQKDWAMNTLTYTKVEAEKVMWWMATNPTIVGKLNPKPPEVSIIDDSDVEYVAALYAQTVVV